MGVLEDKEAIRELIGGYFHTVDFPDAEASVEFFTADAVVELGGRVLRGYDELLAYARQRPGSGMHVASNEVIEVDGDRAHASSYVTFFTAEGGEVQTSHCGRYEDDLVRVDGRWKIQHRTLHVKLPPSGGEG